MGIVRNQSIKNSLSFYIGMIIGALNTVIIYPNAFHDNPEYFGLIQIIIAYGVIISAFTSLSTPQIFLRFFPSINQKGQLYLISFVLPFLGFIIFVLLFSLFKSQIFDILNADNLLKENFYYIIILVFCISFYNVFTSISRSYLDATTPILINEIFLKIYCCIMLLLHWFDYITFTQFLKFYFFGFITKFLILLFIQLYYKRISLSFTISSLKLKKMLKFGLYVLLSGVSVILVTRLDMIMIGALLDLEQVAFYTVAFFIGNAIKVPGRSVFSISAPLIAKAWEEKDMRKINDLYTKSSINQLIIGGVFLLCIWTNIDDIFSLLPEKFQGGKWVVLYIGLSQLFHMANGLNGAIIVNSRYYRYDLYTNILLVFLTIVTNYLFIKSLNFGINGAAIATAIAVFIFNSVRFLVIKKYLNMNPFTIKTIYTLIVFLFILLVTSFIPKTGVVIFDIILFSLIVILLFLPFLFKLSLSEDMIKLLYDFRNKLKIN